MIKEQYIKIQITKLGSEYHRIDLLPLNINDGTKEYDLYKLAHMECNDFLLRNNYYPTKKDMDGKFKKYSIFVSKDIKNYTRLFNNLKRIVNHKFQFTKVYVVQ